MVIGGFSFNNVECEKNGLGEFVNGGFWLWDVWIFYVYYFYFIVYDLWFEVYIYKNVWEIVYYRKFVDE